MYLLSKLFIIVGCLCLLYGAAMILYVGIQASFLWFWIGSGIISIIVSIILRYLVIHQIETARWIKIILFLCFFLGCSIFLIVEGTIIYYANQTSDIEADYMIVLGAKVQKKTVSRALRYRLDTTYSYAIEHEKTRIIVSGGQGKGEEVTEAKAMYDYLVAKGIAKERIIMEENSTNTKENIQFSKEKIKDCNKTVLIVSNDFHIYRSVSIAKKEGFTDVYGLPAPTDIGMIPSYYIREGFAVIKDKIIGNM